MSTINIDVTCEIGAELDAYMAELLNGTKITYRVVEAHSSSGGWPLVELTGPRMQLVYAVAVYAGPVGDAEYLISLIVD